MKTKMRPRYYCDHCNKGSGSPSAMRRHERGCTANPDRTCGMCAMIGETQTPRDELIAIMDAEGFKTMCQSANNCPACILAAVRTKNYMDDERGPSVHGPQDGRETWDYKKEKQDFWDAWNSGQEDMC